MEYRDCIVVLGPGLEPWRCARVEISDGRFAVVDAIEPTLAITAGATVLMPALYNAHTHIGDAVAPDGATGLTLEQGFFRPDGYKYRMLAGQPRETLLTSMVDHLGYMAGTGTIAHFDFREQGVAGAILLREASIKSGVESVILNQFDGVPFTADELEANVAALPDKHREELLAMLAVADGFSESTMNDLTEPAWREIRSITEEKGRYRAIHCLESEGYRDVSLKRTGRGDLVRALDVYRPHLVVHLTVADDTEIAALAASGVTAVVNPRANASLGLPLPPVARLLDAGVNLLMGTDNGLLNSPNLLAELDFTYKLAKSQYGDAVNPDPRRILAMATSNVSRLWGGRHAGCIRVGGPADYVEVDFHAPHLKRSQHLVASIVSRVTPADVVSTWRGGRCLYTRLGRRA